MAQSAITAPQACCLDATGTAVWEKNPDALDWTLMSVTKAFTSYYIRMNGSLPDLGETITLTANTENFTSGDVVTVEDMYHSILLSSDNAATDKLALYSIGQTHSSWLGQKFLPEMEAFYTTEFGWTGIDIASPAGMAPVYMSARMVAELGIAISSDDQWLLGVMGTASYATTVAGANPRLVEFDYLGGPIKAAVAAGGGTWVGSKGGSGSGTYAQIIIWETPAGALHTIGIMGAPSPSSRDADITTIVSDVLAGEVIDPPDPEPSGLFRTSGDPVTLALTNGDPVVLT